MKSKPESDDKEQSKRFVEKAKELGFDESGKAFEIAIKTVIPKKKEDDRTSSGT
jgi:hypothetical protein